MVPTTILVRLAQVRPRFGIVEDFQAAGKGKTSSCDVLPDDIRELREEEVWDNDLIDDDHLRPASIHASACFAVTLGSA